MQIYGMEISNLAIIILREKIETHKLRSIMVDKPASSTVTLNVWALFHVNHKRSWYES